MANTINQAAENKKTIVAPIHRTGEAIMIPESISIGEAIEVLAAKQVEEEQVVQLGTNFDAFIWDGAFALANALDKKFGWFHQIKTPGDFFTPDMPPVLYTLKTGPDTDIQVPWGRFVVPGVGKGEGYLNTGSYQNSTGMVCFRLEAQIRRKHSNLYKHLCEEIKAQLQAASLYKGKAVTIKFRDEDGDRIAMPQPDFPRITAIRKEQLIFSRHIEAALEANLYTPITKTDIVRQAGIPLKRGVLLAGPYGTGKTLIATLTAALAIENGWTFLFCQKAADFPDCVRFAQKYQPAVVFSEDIDRVTDEQRDEQMDELLNTIDGVDSKGNEILLVLTTNELENIHQAMLRPGRLDAVIAVEQPDSEAVERLIRLYGGSLIDPAENLFAAGRLLAGSTPSVIREVVERAKLTSLAFTNQIGVLSVEALVNSAQTMKGQLELLNRKPAKEQDPMEIFGRAAAREIVNGIRRAAAETPGLQQAAAYALSGSNGRE